MDKKRVEEALTRLNRDLGVCTEVIDEIKTIIEEVMGEKFTPSKPTSLFNKGDITKLGVFLHHLTNYLEGLKGGAEIGDQIIKIKRTPIGQPCIILTNLSLDSKYGSDACFLER